MSETTKLDGGQELDMDTVRADSDDMVDGGGNATSDYNVSAENSTTYILTNLSRVDDVQVSIDTQDASISTSGVGVQVVAARPAQPSDFVNDADYIDGAVLFRLADEDGSGEIADDTSIDANDLTFSYTAIKE